MIFMEVGRGGFPKGEQQLRSFANCQPTASMVLPTHMGNAWRMGCGEVWFSYRDRKKCSQ